MNSDEDPPRVEEGNVGKNQIPVRTKEKRAESDVSDEAQHISISQLCSGATHLVYLLRREIKRGEKIERDKCEHLSRNNAISLAAARVTDE